MKHTSEQYYDVLVIGAGSGGLTSAVGFAKGGKKVLLIEKEHMGGECTNSGCIPSKALLHHAKEYYAAQKIAGVCPEAETYRTGALPYVRRIVDSILEEETPEQFEKLGITVAAGEAIFSAPCTIQVNGEQYSFRTAIIATGSHPRVIEIPGLEKTAVLTNQNVFALDEIPEKLLVIGAGPIGMELGQAFAMLGSNVTIVTREDRIAARDEERAAVILTKRFEEQGIEVLTNADVTYVDDRVAVITRRHEESEEERRVPFDKVLLAIGRVPTIPQGLEEAGIKFDTRGILVDSQYRTSNKDVYAVGDVADALKFTHVADDAARQVVTRVLSKKLLRVNRHKSVPKVTYTDPELASVGLSHDKVCQKYDCNEVTHIEVPYSLSDRARTDGKTNGVVVMTVRKITGTVLGATIIGERAGELIAVCTLAIDRKISLWALRRTIYAYPTYALLFKKAGDLFFGQTVADLKADLAYLARKHVPKLVALAFWATLLVSFYEYRMMTGVSYKDMLVMLHSAVTTTVWGPVLYMFVYAIRPLVLFPATLLTALSGLLFGLPLGILYTVVGENMSANFAYAIGRFFGKDLKLEDSALGTWVEALRDKPFVSVLFMRLFYIPFDLTNFGSGVLHVPWRAYALATLIGIMPGLITFVALGAGIKDITTFELSADSFDFVSLGIAVAVFVVSLLLSRWLKRWHAMREQNA